MLGARRRRLESTWRQLLASYLDLRRPLTRWDYHLATVSSARWQQDPAGNHDVLPPSYLPAAFLDESADCFRKAHVGVQLRRLPANPDGRDSDVDGWLRQAEELAGALGLELLVYGEPSGSYIPEGYAASSRLADGRLLAWELGALRNCRVMLAPNSGWADLMCWLRTPVIVEATHNAGEIFRHMGSFAPRLTIRRPSESIVQQAEWLFDGNSDVPPLALPEADASHATWLRGGRLPV